MTSSLPSVVCGAVGRKQHWAIREQSRGSQRKQAQACAQAQAQRQETVSHTESLDLVRSLLRVSVFHTCYLRGLFPEHLFKSIYMKNLNGMNLKMLQGRDEESRRMIEWVEKGIYDAVDNSYLKRLYFGVSADQEGADLVEEYIFSFSYGENGITKLDIDVSDAKANRSATADIRTAAKQMPDPESIRHQVVRMMRLLIEITSTLDQLPDERFIFMKLTYIDDVPDDYEPPMFQAATQGQRQGYFLHKPFSMQCGKVATGHHEVKLQVKSLLDSVEPVEAEAEMEMHEEPEGIDTAVKGLTLSAPSVPAKGLALSAPSVPVKGPALSCLSATVLGLHVSCSSTPHQQLLQQQRHSHVPPAGSSKAPPLRSVTGTSLGSLAADHALFPDVPDVNVDTGGQQMDTETRFPRGDAAGSLGDDLRSQSADSLPPRSNAAVLAETGAQQQESTAMATRGQQQAVTGPVTDEAVQSAAAGQTLALGLSAQIGSREAPAGTGWRKKASRKRQGAPVEADQEPQGHCVVESQHSQPSQGARKTSFVVEPIRQKKRACTAAAKAVGRMQGMRA